MRIKIIKFCLLSLTYFISLDTSAELITPRQENMIKAMIDAEYDLLKSQKKNAKQPLAMEHSLISRNQPLTDQTKAETLKKVQDFIQQNAKTSNYSDYANLSQKIDNISDIKWIIFTTVMMSYEVPTFICQENDQLCRHSMTDPDQTLNQFELSQLSKPDALTQAVQSICQIENDCSQINKDDISEKIRKEVGLYNPNKREKQLEQQLKKLNLEYHYGQ
ncbi:hypothetical protein [Acinetobacter sp. CFCC 10889]|uniref:hypothetical protein n=1 Tax=Acinetobacter sp. CFCC 10889 TaxID=1775557 RepID=UPI000DD04945|nr:hypothetical protein [Acinetobacter sp. CFCC 10889]